MADKTVDEDAVYEVTKILWAHLKDFEKYTAIGKGLVPDFVTSSSWGPEEREQWYHPGALKFYKETGIALQTQTVD